MSRGRLTRARLLAAGAGLAAAVGLAPLRPWRRLVEVTPGSAAFRPAALLGGGQAARAVGTAALAESAVEQGADALLAAVARSLPGGPDALEAPTAELRTALVAAIAEDFDRGRTVVVSGWILSVTEARVCALAALAAR